MPNRMNIMVDRPRNLVLLAIVAAGMLPVAAAQAHWDGLPYAEPAPLYPYAVQGEQPFASSWRRTSMPSRTACAPTLMCTASTAAAAARRSRSGAGAAPSIARSSTPPGSCMTRRS